MMVTTFFWRKALFDDKGAAMVRLVGVMLPVMSMVAQRALTKDLLNGTELMMENFPPSQASTRGGEARWRHRDEGRQEEA